VNDACRRRIRRPKAVENLGVPTGGLRWTTTTEGPRRAKKAFAHGPLVA
jgi:hypothetical protein